MEISIKYQACLLCESLVRNINDNFKSVSFEVYNNGDIQTKIVLIELTEEEKELIDDLLCEFAARQERNCVLEAIVKVGNSEPLKNIVYLCK